MSENLTLSLVDLIPENKLYLRIQLCPFFWKSIGFLGGEKKLSRILRRLLGDHLTHAKMNMKASELFETSGIIRRVNMI